MIHYVLGFAIWQGNVLLIRKNRPDWQAGLYNGVGGKANVNEAWFQAMRREFLEETGIQTCLDDWTYRGTMTVGSIATVHIFSSKRIDITKYRNTTDEELSVVDMELVLSYKTLPSIKYLWPLILADECDMFRLAVIKTENMNG